jgi:hypothetical protein
MFGWRFYLMIIVPALFAALFGAGCWAVIRYHYGSLDPVDLAPTTAPLGGIQVATAANWMLLTGLPVLVSLGVVFGMSRGAVWLDRYTNRDAYGDSPLALESPPLPENA